MKRIALLSLLVTGVVWGALLHMRACRRDGGRERGFRNGLGKARGLASQRQLRALRLGEAIPPGGLLTAGAESPAHSMSILLPDGQRMLCECYEAKQLLPGLPRSGDYSAPAARGLGDVCRSQERSVAAAGIGRDRFPTPAGREAMAGKLEMVAAVSPQGEISIAPALRVLPSGQYGLEGSQRWRKLPR